MDSDESQEGTIAEGAGFILVATILSTGIGFVIRTFLIRQLPTADYGLFALAITVGGLLTTVCSLGLRQGVARMVPRCETESGVRDVTLTALTSALGVSVLVSGTMVLFPSSISQYVIREPGLAPYLPVVGALVPGMTIQTVVIATFRGKKQVQEPIIIRNLVSPIARFGLIASVVLLGYGAFGAIVAWTTGVLLSTGVGIYSLSCRTNTFTGLTFTPRHRELLVFSLPLMFSSVMWTAVQQVDNLLIGYYETSVEVAIYDGAFLLARLLIIALSAFGFLFMPIFSELDESNELDRMQGVYQSTTEWAVLLVLPLYIALVLNPDTILTIVFGADYSLAAIPMVIILTGFFIHVLSGLSGDALIALGNTQLIMVGNIGVGIVNILLNIGLIPRWGIIGAAVASASSYALFNLGYLYWLYRDTGIVPFSKKFFVPLTLSSTILACIWLFANTQLELSMISIVTILSLSYLPHLAVIIRTKRITSGDKELMSKILAFREDKF
ncbi:oligosaccharide flippase family protein [Haloarcula salinisoli]|uniref:Oligosaccharide flippase family protein n=1 Tax=Haloarcula salinisoli TaxID=2487746 RepID=A0A8J8C8T5_9EURY|nr:oligosaccharide flippase family protein [Halomicroarcula salinisoli]MBX0287823.1 oligosaccharide flippase family protein [Halomicroarcula salinisoli]MBX0304766.1 oligosaccharide flippase family protein [Halomicroarcula salinisoli]